MASIKTNQIKQKYRPHQCDKGMETVEKLWLSYGASRDLNCATTLAHSGIFLEAIFATWFSSSTCGHVSDQIACKCSEQPQTVH